MKGIGPEERFDRVTRTAARAFGVPIATISVVDGGRELFKSGIGLDVLEVPGDVSMGAYVMGAEGALVVDDMTADERFIDNPLVTGLPHLRFYAGQALRALDGVPVGVLAVMDRSPRVFTREDRVALDDLGAWAEAELAAATAAPARQMQELERLKAEFLASAAHKLRTPLTAIIGFADLLEGTDADPRTTIEYVAIIRDNAEKLNDLVGDLLEPAKGPPTSGH